MTWKFPKRIPRTGTVVDSDDFNDGIQPFVEEDGRLNEHNWNQDLQTQLARTDLADDVSFRVLHKSNIIDASDTDQGSPVSFFATNTWQTVAMDGSAASYSFTSRGGALGVMASLQLGLPGEAGAWGNGTTGAEDSSKSILAYAKVGILIDGALEPLSVVGDQDSLHEGLSMETGVTGYLQGTDLFLTVPIGPGEHSVAVVISVDELEEETEKNKILVYTTELLVWEIR